MKGRPNMPVSLEQVKRRMTLAKASPEVERFSEQLFAKANTELFEVFDAESLYAITLSSYKYFQKAESGFSLRVYNPEYQADGWEAPYTLVELRLTDRPFIVDSIKAALERQGYELYHLLHPILAVQRDESGALLSFSESNDTAFYESYELYFIERIDDLKALKALEQHLSDVLNDVVLVTTDYKAMRERLGQVKGYLQGFHKRRVAEKDFEKAEALSEYASFLSWLDEDNFVFLGYREYDIVDIEAAPYLKVDAASGMGILSKAGSTYQKPVAINDLPPELRARVVGGRVVLVSKTNAESSVHRPVRMDYIGIKKLNEAWQVQGEQRFIGLFTSKALATPVEQIPLLRLKLRRVLALDNAVQGSHDFKQISSIFNSMPRDGLFWADAEQLHKDIRTIMSLEQERGVRLSMQPDPLGRGLSAMVMMPRERFNADVRRDIQAYLSTEFQASHIDYQLAMGEDESQLRFHFFFVTNTSFFDLDLPRLERHIVELTRTWNDHLVEKLTHSFGDVKGKQLADKYQNAFDDVYKADTSYTTALRDIEQFEVLAGQGYLVDLLNPIDKEAITYLNIYHEQKTLFLSDVMPLLENLGFVVLEQSSYALSLENSKSGVDIFQLTDANAKALDVRKDGERLANALQTLLKGEAESDALNQLVLTAELSIREVSVLLAYRMYDVQLQASVSRGSVTQALLNHPKVAKLLFAAFAAKFDPNYDADRLAAFEQYKSSLEDYLATVRSLAEDSILRRLFNLIEATVRTNFFMNKVVMSFKLNSSLVSSMPEPRPMFEIGVYGLSVEGTHLRGGKVARGGLRWSDRPDDFRTEVLGLMKTQMTKNAVIVPVGSKGGFIVKRAPSTRDELRAYVETQYRAYIAALLDITDNVVNASVVHPENLIVYDEADPYLVVAADKGTASFSDIANSISEDYGFWLGDAFASGGSNGYDHKKEAITARGAWECVKRHFAEMNLDVMKDSFSVMGIGDMSGDVFGNGLLYSDKIKLQAAFNHLHIFIDPNPDPALSFKERQRLFDTPRSSWSDYQLDLISEGGGIFERSAKAIVLSPEMKTMLASEAHSLSGQELVKAILQMQVDLFWNGGIGTYVKASSEQHNDAGDSSNDAVRINALELGARVVGEGGNLGFTQLGRIEYALAGGRINTDAIDNSAGVDMSDHEVNIKIMLQPLVVSGDLSNTQRNRLLEQMTDDVSELVLKDNQAQSLALSLAQEDSQQDLRPFVDFMDDLAQERLDPQVEFLPNREALDLRAQHNQGLSRPELAILLAYSKMRTYDTLLASDLPEQKGFESYLLSYFPKSLQSKHPEALLNHSLKREIIATQVTNQVTDLLGITFSYALVKESQANYPKVLATSVSMLELLAIHDFKAKLESSGVAMSVQYAVLSEVRQTVRRLVAWQLSAATQLQEENIRILCAKLRSFLPKEEKKRFDQALKKWQKQDLLTPLAEHLVALSYLPNSIGIIQLAQQHELKLDTVAKQYYDLGQRFSLGWWRDALHALAPQDIWEQRALRSLVAEFRDVQTALTQQALKTPQDARAEFYDQILAEVKQSNAVSLASGTVAIAALRELL